MRIKNEIIVAPDGARIIVGPLAHKLAFEKNPPTFFVLDPSERFLVFEFYADGSSGTRWTHRAAQSTRDGAIKYMNRSSVLVEYKRS